VLQLSRSDARSYRRAAWAASPVDDPCGNCGTRRCNGKKSRPFNPRHGPIAILTRQVVDHDLRFCGRCQVRIAVFNEGVVLLVFLRMLTITKEPRASSLSRPSKLARSPRISICSKSPARPYPPESSSRQPSVGIMRATHLQAIGRVRQRTCNRHWGAEAT
jgi:hypothetical protein